MVEFSNPIKPVFWRRQRLGFTLVEMLVVMVIIAIITGIAIPNIIGVLRGYGIIDAGGRVLAALNEGRQAAISKNTPVEVRFYADPNNNNLYDCVVTLVPPDSYAGTPAQWLSRPLVLPTKTCFDTNSVYSSVLTSAVNLNHGIETNTGAAARVLGQNYAAFRFRPDGSTDLSASGSPWCLTIDASQGGKAVPGAPAADYITILIDPTLGSTRLYQPR